MSSATPPSSGTASPLVGDITDKRLLRGARTRRAVLDRAVDLASLDGLEGLSFGRLATDTGLSKAGIQSLFRTKEALQLATVDHARSMFVDFVVRPALSEPRGVARIRELIGRWIVYAERPLFAGGCFQAANLTEFDSRPGPVRDALARNQQEWVDALSGELAVAVENGEIADLDADLAAFQIDAVLRSANTAMRLGDGAAGDKVRRIVEGLLRPPGRTVR
ncbi:transcriptional regulator [Rhodococcus ruber Chol-4]|uniref:Transcriptional regulator n=1 Tax=Rhodococcus ruber TaxID=1830 RepID=A0A098BPC3_9NOCA|nr:MULTISPECIES: TetR/AcrR family transcriptional regulator [Rhodococcus]MDO2377321.1 TetR/AcrR family transcriptional regulator [Rhodococcus ruber]RIK13959.1 MAG: TetR/AcrR family transcriptional regulator [Acidobacteriota bacterium]ATQ30652.1 TetR/AcrR family transcriptional regulator [Rhodococcus ruber]AUM16851.1 TetR/AcrR family transcriptional regulator [Rhodococcus ruber]AWG97595.1 TetR/AcrR family transcriptional regulator [Rhodococcus ruber]